MEEQQARGQGVLFFPFVSSCLFLLPFFWRNGGKGVKEPHSDGGTGTGTGEIIGSGLYMWQDMIDRPRQSVERRAFVGATSAATATAAATVGWGGRRR